MFVHLRLERRWSWEVLQGREGHSHCSHSVGYIVMATIRLVKMKLKKGKNCNILNLANTNYGQLCHTSENSYIYISMHTCEYTVHMHACEQSVTHTHTHSRSYTHTRVHTHTHVFIHTHSCSYTQAHTHTHTHTHTHRHIVVVRPWESGMRCMVECHFPTV